MYEYVYEYATIKKNLNRFLILHRKAAKQKNIFFLKIKYINKFIIILYTTFFKILPILIG